MGFVQARVSEWSLSTLPSPIPELQHAPLPLKVLWARERAPTPLSSAIFYLDSHLSLSRNWECVICAYITSTTTSSTNFGVLVYVIKFLDPFVNDPIFCTNMFPSSNSNGNPFAYLSLLIRTCSFDGLNSTKEGFVSTFSICNLIAFIPSCVYYYCC